jgi:hypothetical protein
MRNIFLVGAMTMFVVLPTFGTDCTSAIQLREHVQNGKRAITAKNTSNRPIVAYVIAGGARDATGNPIHVFYGVSDNGDSLRPGASMEIGSVDSSGAELTSFVDYVRAAGGWSCGSASTEQAKQVVSRFSK